MGTLNHSTFISSYFFLDKESAQNWRNSSTIAVELVLKTWFSLCTSGNCYANFLDCLVGYLCMTHVKVKGDFFGLSFGNKRSTCTRVNTALYATSA